MIVFSVLCFVVNFVIRWVCFFLCLISVSLVMVILVFEWEFEVGE